MPLKGRPMAGGPEAFAKYCRRLAPLLDAAGSLGLDAFALLHMLGGVESSFGAEAHRARYEKAYDVGGRYFSPELTARFGRDAACSYGPFQIMFVNAWATDTAVTPNDMLDPLIAGFISCEYLNKRLRRDRPSTPAAVLDMWNTGTSRDKIKPDPRYAEKGVGYYESAMTLGAG